MGIVEVNLDLVEGSSHGGKPRLTFLDGFSQGLNEYLWLDFLVKGFQDNHGVSIMVCSTLCVYLLCIILSIEYLIFISCIHENNIIGHEILCVFTNSNSRQFKIYYTDDCDAFDIQFLYEVKVEDKCDKSSLTT